MNKLMSRYKGLIFSCVSVMIIAVCVCSFSFESKAADVQFETRYSKPHADDFCGYIEINTYSASRDHNLCYVIMWTMSDAANGPMMMNISLNASDINFIATGGADWVTISDLCLDGYSFPQVLHNGLISSSGYTFTFWSDYKAVAYHVYGNYGSISTNMGQPDYYGDSFTVLYGSDLLLQNKLNEILAELKTSNANDSKLLAKADEILTSNKAIEDKIDALIELQESTNSWLEKIWNSIQEFFTPNEEDKAESEEFENETTEKSDTLDSLNEQNKTDKTDIDGASSSVDENVDLESIDNYGNVLVVVTENEYILQILLLVFSIALVGYVLFGKR